MPGELLGALDNIIAVVVVILILSLIVQSLQAFFKKLFAIKSKQIGDSLVELFEHVVGSGNNVRPGVRVASPVLRALTFGKDPSDHASPDAKKLFKEVVDRFSKLGRVSPRGKWVTESISKEDLLKIIANVASNKVITNFTTGLQQVCADVANLKKVLDAVPRADLPGSASAELARVEHVLAPLFSDCAALLDSSSAVRADVLLEEVLRITVETLDPALTILTSVQNSVAEAGKVTGADVKTLNAVGASLRDVASAIATFRESFEAAFAPLRARLTSMGTWFDTVMQSFEERYTRGMKTWSIVIGVAVVILLNANLFKIYETISANNVMRETLVEKVGPRLLKEQATTAGEPAAAQSEPAQSSDGGDSEENPAIPQQTDNLRRPQGVDVQGLETDLDKAKAMVREYNGLGMTPFTSKDLGKWADGFFHRESELGDISGWKAWWSRRGDDVRTLFGWFLMVVLLSFGAPFWHDALETLFGVKNLVRKRSSTQNVEERGGAGNPKP